MLKLLIVIVCLLIGLQDCLAWLKLEGIPHMTGLRVVPVNPCGVRVRSNLVCGGAPL